MKIPLGKQVFHVVVTESLNAPDISISFELCVILKSSFKSWMSFMKRLMSRRRVRK